MHASLVKPYRLLLLGLCAYLIFFTSMDTSAQPVSREATFAYRQKIYRNLIQNTIQKNLSVPLTIETEDQWNDALHAMLLLQYQSDWTNLKIREAFETFNTKPVSLFIPVFEYLYSLRMTGFGKWAHNLLERETDPKHLAILVQYLMLVDRGDAAMPEIKKTIIRNTKDQVQDPITESVLFQLTDPSYKQPLPIDQFFSPGYLPGHVLILSIQRSNRNYPGLFLVRDTAGHWLRDSTGGLAAIRTLARSQNNLPGYLPNGNTPEGLFRMDGFAESASGFIGPSTNIQLTMPFEYKAGHFYSDSTLSDSSWSIEAYDRLLPAGMRGYFPAYESYRAGKAGRREIIIHGSTVDPSWYRSFPFFPFAPTLGCLTTKESWDPENGQRVQSDQQNLVDLVIKAGGPHGYLMVLNLNSRSGPVSADEIQTILQQAGIQ